LAALHLYAKRAQVLKGILISLHIY